MGIMQSLTWGDLGRNQMAAKVVSFINLKGGVGKSTLSMMVSEFLFSGSAREYC